MNLFNAPDMVSVSKLLQANQLPTADLSKLNPDYFIGCGERHDPMGYIGLETFESDGLLRSLVVDERARGQGCGKALVQELESFAKDSNIKTLYLLTETAEDFFTILGFERIERTRAPISIRQSDEFNGLCSDNAVLMCKTM